MAIPRAKGGTREYLDTSETFRHFQILSNELASPKVLSCPADVRIPAQNFAALANTNVSYFVGLDAEETRPIMLLSGDRNLSIAKSPDQAGTGEQKWIIMTPNSTATWGQGQHYPDGNIVLADGSVLSTTPPQLQTLVGNSRYTNRIAFP